MKNPLSRTKRKFRCIQDKKTKEIKCWSYREMPDGTIVKLAGMQAQVDPDCQPVTTDMWEAENGELEILEKKIVNRITAKCKKKTPEEY